MLGCVVTRTPLACSSAGDRGISVTTTLYLPCCQFVVLIVTLNLETLSPSEPCETNLLLFNESNMNT